jgi:ParB family chromosome partitioning protein
MPAFSREALREFGRIYPERLPAGEEEQAEISRLTAEYEALLDQHGEDPPEEVGVQCEALSERIDALSEGTEHWGPEDITLCGAVVGIGHGGRIVVERGLLRPEDAPAESSPARLKAGAVAKPRREDGLSDRLVEDLTAHRTAALRAILAGNADVALAAVVHALALPLFYPHSGESCLALDLRSEGLEGSATGFEDSAAARSLAERHDAWKQKLPQRAEGLWDWLLAQDTATRLDLMAHCAGCSVNAVKKVHERADAGRFVHADQLAAALDLDMAQWWQPTGASYLSRVPKAKVLEAVSEGVTKAAAENLAKLKKEALVTHAEERLAGTGWLPAMLRRKLPGNRLGEPGDRVAELALITLGPRVCGLAAGGSRIRTLGPTASQHLG